MSFTCRVINLMQDVTVEPQNKLGAKQKSGACADPSYEFFDPASVKVF